jgi:hypothetical protein
MEDQEDKMPEGSGLTIVPRTGIVRPGLSGFPLGFPVSSLKYGTVVGRKQEFARYFGGFDVGMPLAQKCPDDEDRQLEIQGGVRSLIAFVP